MSDGAGPPADGLTPELGTNNVTRSARDETPLPPVPRPHFAPGQPVPFRPAWTLVKELGRGGFGEVWQTKHEWKSELGAIKFCTHPDARHQLIAHEKKVIVRVMRYAGDHPHIVPLLDYDFTGDVPWLMYQYVEGGTLADAVLEWQKLPIPRRLGRAAITLYGLARALKRVHRLDPPIVHRDLKPANILMERGLPRITDFGIGGAAAHAAVAGSLEVLAELSVKLPTMLMAMGTFRYASPEQLFGNPPDPRDDVYALGIIGYQLALADLKAAPGTDAADILRENQVPKELISLIVRSVAMDPERRPQNAREWERTLRPWMPRKPGSTSDSTSTTMTPLQSPETRREIPRITLDLPPKPPPRTPEKPVPAPKPAPVPPPAQAAQPPADRTTFCVTVPGLLLSRPVTEPQAAWKEVTKTPTEVDLVPTLVYCVRVNEKVTEQELEGLRGLQYLAPIRHLNLSWCEQVTDAALEHLKEYTALESLDLMGCKRVTDVGLAHLRHLSAIEHLTLRWCSLVTDAGLGRLKRLSALRTLDLMGCGELTDAGVAHLKRFTQLQNLNLRWCEQITDAGLVHLQSLSELRALSLSNCAKLTDVGVAGLKAALPKCQIER